jgi:hypothetical protein
MEERRREELIAKNGIGKREERIWEERGGRREEGTKKMEEKRWKREKKR